MALAALMLATTAFPSCAPVRVTGSGNVISRTFDFTDFTRLRISYGFTAEVKASGSYGIEVTADDNLFDYILVEKDGDTLSFRLKPGSYERSQLRAAVMMPGLRGIELSDGGRTDVSGFNSPDDLTVSLSDGTHLTGSLTAGNVDISLTDGSRIQLAGSGKDIRIVSHDGSDADLEKFTVANADLNIGDGGTLAISVTGTLNADLSAGAHGTYSGNPAMGVVKISSGATLDKNQ